MKVKELLLDEALQRRKRLHKICIQIVIVSGIFLVLFGMKAGRLNGFGVVSEIVCAIALCSGTALRIFPTVTAAWRSPFGRIAVMFSSAFIAVIATLPAQSILIEALQLPAGDFPCTAALLTLFCYPVVAAVIIAVAIGCVWIFTMAIVGSLALPSWLLQAIPFQLFVVDWGSSRMRTLSERIRKRMEISLFDFVAYSLMICLTLSVAAGWYHLMDQPNLVRIFAYWADYENPGRYPGTEQHRFRLHDNGVVSYADFRKWDVDIRMSCLKGLSCPGG
ncbi:hypothetical protein [Paraburkholderia sp. C35]|uniref:hypothetical protein n=1 Tax=Paraburkholderia sp. C35 TaxID=2126993 RepID=UPI000D689887|nr:hypothetical protein [Paraburkholderia sp. C35]